MKPISGRRETTRRSASCPAALLAALTLLIATACGQKAGVYDPAAGPGVASAPSESGSFIVDAATGEIVAATSDQPEGSTGTIGSRATAPHSSASSSQRSNHAARAFTRGLSDPASAPSPPTGGSTSGVGPATIKLGMHMPITGAAPVPPAAVPGAVSRYWDHLRAQGHDIGGRYVEVILKDDRYDTTTAKSVCKEMVERDKVFALVGFAGPHTIEACARYASKVGVPYFAPGGAEQLLTGLPTHFGLSMTYIRQNPLVADLLVRRFDARRKENALVRPKAAEIPDHFVTQHEAMAARGARFEVDHQVNPQASPEEMRLVVFDLKQRAIENVWLVGNPFHFIYFTQEAAKQEFHPRIVGPGITASFDFVLDVTCPHLRAGHDVYLLHPAPAFVDNARFDQSFGRAGGSNEFEWLFWGLWKPIGELLGLPGRDLTRERLLWYTARARNIETGVFPPISFSPRDHFGGRQMHLLRSDCDDKRWHTDKAFFGLHG